MQTYSVNLPSYVIPCKIISQRSSRLHSLHLYQQSVGYHHTQQMKSNTILVQLNALILCKKQT